MLNMREIIDYGPCYVLAINCPADGIDLPRKATLFDVSDSETHETLDTFRTARQAKKFARYYLYRQYLYKKALAVAAILSKYKMALYVATNCAEPLVWNDCYLSNDRASFWFDEPPEVVKGYFGDQDIDESLPLDLKRMIWTNNEAKRQYDFAVFSGQAGDCYCMDEITDIWPIDDKTFVFESADGHTYAVQGLDDDEAKLAAAIHYGIII